MQDAVLGVAIVIVMVLAVVVKSANETLLYTLAGLIVICGIGIVVISFSLMDFFPDLFMRKSCASITLTNSRPSRFVIL